MKKIDNFKRVFPGGVRWYMIRYANFKRYCQIIDLPFDMERRQAAGMLRAARHVMADEISFGRDDALVTEYRMHQLGIPITGR